MKTSPQKIRSLSKQFRLGKITFSDYTVGLKEIISSVGKKGIVYVRRALGCEHGKNVLLAEFDGEFGKYNYWTFMNRVYNTLRVRMHTK